MSDLTCQQCGTKLTPADRFCPSCGRRAAKRTNRRKSARRNARRLNPIGLLAGGGAILLIVAIMLALNPGQSSGAADAKATATSNIPYPEAPRITLAAARAALDQEGTIFLDIRSGQEYEEAHVPGSILMPLTELTERLHELPLNASIITYCT